MDSTNCTAPSGAPEDAMASLMRPARAVLDWMASFPPRKTTALPDFKQRDEISTVTFGRLS